MPKETALRLFLALDCPGEIKSALAESAALLARSCLRGSFTRPENHHLTLAFLGQVPRSRVSELAGLMDGCAAAPFSLTIGHLGRFKGRDGDLIWRQADGGEALLRLQAELERRLRAQGFAPEDRAYRPHLTLARRAVLAADIELRALSEQMPPLRFTAGEISLLSSRLTADGPVYTPLHRAVLQDSI